MALLHDITNRRIPPVPWEEGENIPWHDPVFSGRMLMEHLSQDHDLASRKLGIVEAQVDWIHRSLLHEEPARVLDLTCGPGLYLNQFARLGHDGVGIDFSPAAIAYARQEADKESLPVEYVEGDVRSTQFGDEFDLVTLLYGQLNVFRRTEAAAIVKRAAASLAPGGIFVAEPQTFSHVKDKGLVGPVWSGQSSGLFSDQPHLLLTESFWDEERRTGTQRIYVIDADSGDVTTHALSNEAYTDEELVSLFSDAGIRDVDVLPSLPSDIPSQGFLAVVGRK